MQKNVSAINTGSTRRLDYRALVKA